jgi:hypothetical protein
MNNNAADLKKNLISEFRNLEEIWNVSFVYLTLKNIRYKRKSLKDINKLRLPLFNSITTMMDGFTLTNF